MALIQVLHMNGGLGDTSYAKNSSVQRNIINSENPKIQEAITGILRNKNMDFPASFGIADLGCSSGPNTLTLISEIMEMVNSAGRVEREFQVEEIRVYLNDLPGNDFNAIFCSLPEFYQKQKAGFGDTCFVSCVGGSFYGRLFPKKSLHFVHSSSSLHWLSQIPPQLDGNICDNAMNTGKIYISKSSPDSVWKAYSQQFRTDFALFLKSRSEETVPGGRMVLSFLGRKTSDPTTEDSCYQWELLARAINSLVSKGQISKEKIDNFNAPYYAPSIEEVKNIIGKEGSFLLNSLDTFEVKWDSCSGKGHAGADEEEAFLSFGSRVAKTIRAVVESMFEAQFGRENMDDLFIKFAELVDDYSLRSEPAYTNLVVSVTRK